MKKTRPLQLGNFNKQPLKILRYLSHRTALSNYQRKRNSEDKQESTHLRQVDQGHLAEEV